MQPQFAAVFFRMEALHDLRGIPLDALHAAFLEAFSDYAIPMQLPPDRFRRLLEQNGYDPAASVGAFDAEKLIGFILCAPGRYAGKQTLYDCGTGVLPAYRGKRIGSAMLQQLKTSSRAEQFVLEVLQNNASAVALYTRHGFTRVRELLCFRCAKDALTVQAVMPVTVCDELPDVLSAQTSGLWDNAPTWQNSTASIRRAGGAQRFAYVSDGAYLLGYAVLNQSNGSLPQIAVRREYRGLSVGSTLLYALSTVYAGDSLHAINVDSRDSALCSALLAWGFEQYARQFEMACTL